MKLGQIIAELQSIAGKVGFNADVAISLHENISFNINRPYFSQKFNRVLFVAGDSIDENEEQLASIFSKREERKMEKKNTGEYFYIVILKDKEGYDKPGLNGYYFKHLTFESAVSERNKIAVQNPKCLVYIFKALSVACSNNINVTELTEEPLPF